MSTSKDGSPHITSPHAAEDKLATNDGGKQEKETGTVTLFDEERERENYIQNAQKKPEEPK